MNGKFQLEMTHGVEDAVKKDLKEALGLKIFNPIAVQLTEICFKYNKKPAEVVKIYKEIKEEILE